MPAIAYPAERLFSEVTLDANLVRVDGEELPQHNIDRESRAIALYRSGRKDWREAELVLRVEAPAQELRSKGLDDDATNALVRLDCAKTNLRSGQLARLKDGAAQLRLTLRREQVAENATVECFIVRDTEEGFARILRETDSWEITFTEPPVQPSIPGPTRPGGLRDFVRIEWEDFRDPNAINGALNSYAREAYFFDIEAAPPTLYLNRGIEGYERLLMGDNASSSSRTENVFRELEYKRISLGAWLALCFEAISCIIEDEDGQVVPPSDWRGEILRLILPRIFPGESLDAAYEKILRLRGSSGTSAYLIGKLEIAVNEHVNTSTTLKKHLMALLREGAA